MQRKKFYYHVAGTIIAVTLAEDIATCGAGIWNDVPSFAAAGAGFNGTMALPMLLL